MEKQIKIKNVFKSESVCKEFFTGGWIQLTNDGKSLLCQCRNHVSVVNVETASISKTIPTGLNTFNAYEETELVDDYVSTFNLSNDNTLLATGHKSGIIRIWKWQDSELVTSWKAGHKGPLVKLAFNENNTYLATGSTDSVLKVWNIESHTCISKLTGVQDVTSILQFETIKNVPFLFASGGECIIRGWSLRDTSESSLEFKLNGHYSTVTKILFTVDIDNSYLISCSRDKTIIVWNLETKKAIRTIPVYESIETAAMLPDCIHLPNFEKPVLGVLVAVGDEKGNIKIWNVLKGKELYVHQSSSSKSNPGIAHLFYDNSQNHLYEVNSHHYITLYNLDTRFSCYKQMTGYLDEILDMTFFGEDENYLAVAANSCDIHVYDKKLNCSLLKGHSDIVVSLAASHSFPNILVSGSKDNSIRIWMMKDEILNCVAIGSRHTGSVVSVALSLTSAQHAFVVSGSEDKTLKLWKLPVLKYKTCATLTVSRTEIAHDDTINSVCISPNDAIVATASKDKTAKLWSTKDLSLIGVLRGHRRGVWCVRFSSVDQVLLTSSADTTLRLWSITELNCLKTIEGQDSAVLNCAFYNNGIQILSCGSDGLIKVWSIKGGECVTTLDQHAAKVWAIAVRRDESEIVTGGVDSRMIFWKDRTEENRLEDIKSGQEKVKQEQLLANLIKANELLPALQLAIKLDRPMQTYKIVESLSTDKVPALKSIVDQLREDHKETLLRYATVWNANSRYCAVAQLVVSLLLEEIASKKLKVSEKTLEGLVAYTNRHNQRLNGLMEDLHLVSYTLKMMQPNVSL